jgi:hypothetical protein
MRVGQNPSKEQPIAPSGKTHQVVIPVYIPHQNDYYAQSFEVFQLCISSLLNTCHANTSITVVNNGSCEAVKSYLDGLLKNKQIDELVHTGNIGKLNAILKGLCGHRFPWVTIADADTLFLNDWQKATYKVFEAFPKAGVVGLTPQMGVFKYQSNNVLFDNFFSKALKFQGVKEPQAMQRFYKSIGWDDNYNKDNLKQTLALLSPIGSALVGSGHYVATYKAAMFKTIPTFMNAKLGRNTEQYLDELPLKFGLWRLTTVNNYAYHMGNTVEDWMLLEFQKLKSVSNEQDEGITYILPSKTSYPIYIIKNKLFSKLFKWPFFYRLFLSYKGLPKEMIKKY